MEELMKPRITMLPAYKFDLIQYYLHILPTTGFLSKNWDLQYTSMDIHAYTNWNTSVGGYVFEIYTLNYSLNIMAEIQFNIVLTRTTVYCRPCYRHESYSILWAGTAGQIETLWSELSNLFIFCGTTVYNNFTPYEK